MLSKKHRLSKAVEVKKTAVKGRGFFNPYFVIKKLPNQLQLARVTFVVSTKISKKAVDRNRIKRVLREEWRKSIDAIKPADYMVITKPAIMKIDNSEIRRQLNQSLQHLDKVKL